LVKRYLVNRQMDIGWLVETCLEEPRSGYPAHGDVRSESFVFCGEPMLLQQSARYAEKTVQRCIARADQRHDSAL